MRTRGHGGRVLYEVPLQKIAPGRVEEENTLEGRFLLSARTGFEIVDGPDGVDRPFGGALYRPKGTHATLTDGSFHWGPAPLHPHPPRYEEHHLHDHALDHTFRIRVCLPRDYPLRAPYPVAVFNDGQNIWTHEGAHGGWWVDRAADRQARAGRARDVVIVGVWCHRFRNRAYLPPPLGRSDQYVAFLRDRLIPFLRARYLLSHAPAETAILGASYGANAGVYAGLAAPETFGLVGSLSFANLRGGPLRRWMESLPRLPFKKLYMDAGTKWAIDQPRRDDNTNLTRRIQTLAEAKGMIHGLDLLGVIGEGQVHNEDAWRKRTPGALAFLFPPRSFTGRREG